MTKLQIKAMKMADEIEDLNFNGKEMKETINMNIEKVKKLAPELMAKMYDQDFLECTVDVGVDFMSVSFTIIGEDFGKWAEEDFDEMVRNGYEEELIALIEYMKEVG